MGKSPYDLGKSGDFHNGRPNFFLMAIDGALNAFADKVEPYDQLELMRQIVAGQENTSWFVYDPRELGPLMDAPRGQHDSAVNMSGDWDIRFSITGGKLNLRDPLGGADVQATAYDICLANCSPKDVLYEDTDYCSYLFDSELGQLSGGSFVVDEQRALQSAAFYTELVGLSGRLHQTIDHDPGKSAFLAPRSEDGAQELRLNNKHGN